MQTLLKLISVRHNGAHNMYVINPKMLQTNSKIGLGSFAPNVSQK